MSRETCRASGVVNSNRGLTFTNPLQRSLGLFLLITCVFCGCGSPERPQLITIARVASFRPSDPRQIETIEQAMASIITVCREDLGLPSIDPLYVNLHKNAASMAYWGKHKSLSTADSNMPAFAVGNTIHINLELVGRTPWRSLIRLLAHEYAHNVNYQISGDRQVGQRWFREGFADWVAAKTLHRLGWQQYDVALHRAMQEIIQHRELLPDITLLTQEKHWLTELQKPKGRIRTYNLAFVAFDRLSQREKFGAVKKFIASNDFDGSFGHSWSGFSVDFRNYLKETMKPRRQGAFVLAVPRWRVGDQWTYSESRAGKNDKIIREVKKEETYNGVPVYIVANATEERSYTRDTLGLFVTTRNGRLVESRDKPYEHFNWPLKQDKRWTTTFNYHNLETDFKRAFTRIVLVRGIDQVMVPAGVFRAVRLQAFDDVSGQLVGEYWYAPAVKWIVRSRAYQSSHGVMSELQLVSFNLK